MSDNVKCVHKNCKQDFDIWVENRPLCQKHYEEEYCKEPSKPSEKDIQKKLNA